MLELGRPGRRVGLHPMGYMAISWALVAITHVPVVSYGGMYMVLKEHLCTWWTLKHLFWRLRKGGVVGLRPLSLRRRMSDLSLIANIILDSL